MRPLTLHVAAASGGYRGSIDRNSSSRRQDGGRKSTGPPGGRRGPESIGPSSPSSSSAARRGPSSLPPQQLKRTPSSSSSTTTRDKKDGNSSSSSGAGYSAGESPEKRKNPALYSLASTAAAATTPSPLPSSSPAPSSFLGRRKPEILSPVGGWDQLRAAVENGADCVYFGLSDFNARARASNFDPERDLGEVMTYLHDRGVKVRLVNILIPLTYIL
jgi:hypothetical protein